MTSREQNTRRPALRPATRAPRCKGGVSEAPTVGAIVEGNEQVQSICLPCRAAFEATVQVMDAYSTLLSGVKAQFIDDVMHHYQGNDGWLRLLRALGAEEEEYYCRLGANEAL